MSSKKKTLDWLAVIVCDVLEKNCGKVYADSKRERLAGVERHKVVIWLNELDMTNLEGVAQRLGVPVANLDITRQTARSM